MSAFRGHALPCPSCPEAPLRMFERRLICDTCQGMLLTTSDLSAALADTAGASVELGFADHRPDPRRCPRCVAPMTASQVTALGVDLGRFARCERHGLWLEGGQLVTALTRVGRSVHGNVGGGGAYGGVGGDYRLVARRRPRRRSPAQPVPHDDRPPRPCPSCAGETLHPDQDRWSCTTCLAVFVENARLEEMVMEILGQPWELPSVTGTVGARGCPLCGAAMTVESMGALQLDRCGAHGIWFDSGELAITLEDYGGVSEPAARAETRLHRLLGWFHRR